MTDEQGGHELDSPPWLRVESTLMATSRLVRKVYDTWLAETGLNQSEASVLALLDETGPLAQTDVARRIGMRPAAAGALVDRLEKLRLLERQADPADRRVWRLALLPASAPIVDRIREIDEQLRAELRRGISKAQRRQLALTLESLRRNLHAALQAAIADHASV